ncbi:hypothetical protein E1293_29515 [Actinomadura darangshiensis]|uniref:Uncharacterized protein n=1 Tax=Actinomadura darangshiensis TaxID=705336 RepID=A0A4R5ATQ4_9ACTN|nr:hypothetical protein [Actinomadura darangshiensis]TDD74494.1 hypothetical protein E1293_29515 [Actinomadura darangshiensis]
MTKSPATQSRGRHARPPSALAVRWNRLIGALRESRRRRLAAAGAVTAAVALVAAAAVLALPGGSGSGPRAAVAAGTAASPSPHEKIETAGDPDEITDAVPYFATKDPDKKVVEHVTDVRRSGAFVRVYTDLGEDDENSKPALDLCKWTTQFLEDGGDDEPRVFVHGKSDDNGSVVLANKQSDKDDCEVPETR